MSSGQVKRVAIAAVAVVAVALLIVAAVAGIVWAVRALTAGWSFDELMRASIFLMGVALVLNLVGGLLRMRAKVER